MSAGTRVLPEDLEQYEERLSVRGNDELRIMCSFTYITPNYDVICALKELYTFTRDKHAKVTIILWDMNTLANPYYKKYCADKVESDEAFIQERIDELCGIVLAVGFEKEEFNVFRSSELWRRMVTHESQDLFQQFFSLLARLPVKEYSYLRKASHLFQVALDLFFACHIQVILPELEGEDLDLMYSDYYKIRLYQDARRIMLEQGNTVDPPLFVVMETVPYVVHEERTPEWNMNRNEIALIFLKAENSREELEELFRYFDRTSNIPTSRELLAQELTKHVHAFLQEHRGRYQQVSDKNTSSMLSVHRRTKALEVGQILKSDISLGILTRADGTRTVTELSRELGKSVATISQYTKDLRTKGYVVLEDGKICRRYHAISLRFSELQHTTKQRTR